MTPDSFPRPPPMDVERSAFEALRALATIGNKASGESRMWSGDAGGRMTGRAAVVVDVEGGGEREEGLGCRRTGREVVEKGGGLVSEGEYDGYKRKAVLDVKGEEGMGKMSRGGRGWFVDVEEGTVKAGRRRDKQPKEVVKKAVSYAEESVVEGRGRRNVGGKNPSVGVLLNDRGYGRESRERRGENIAAKLLASKRNSGGAAAPVTFVVPPLPNHRRAKNLESPIRLLPTEKDFNMSAPKKIPGRAVDDLKRQRGMSSTNYKENSPELIGEFVKRAFVDYVNRQSLNWIVELKSELLPRQSEHVSANQEHARKSFEVSVQVTDATYFWQGPHTNDGKTFYDVALVNIYDKNPCKVGSCETRGFFIQNGGATFAKYSCLGRWLLESEEWALASDSPSSIKKLMDLEILVLARPSRTISLETTYVVCHRVKWCNLLGLAELENCKPDVVVL